MQDPKTKKTDDFDFESIAKPVDESFDFESIAEPVNYEAKKNSAQELQQPLQQPIAPSATPTTENEEFAPVSATPTPQGYELKPIEVVAATPTPQGYELKPIEVVAEKPNEYEKMRGAYLYGLKNYTENDEDYDILRSNVSPARKIELLEKRRSEQLPIENQDFLQEAAGAIGGTIKGMGKSMLAGFAAAPLSPISSVIASTGVAMGDGFRQGFASAYKEAYNDAIQQGLTPEQAIEKAENVAQMGGYGGVAEGFVGALPLTKPLTKLAKPASKLFQKGLEIAVDASVDASVAAGAQLGTNIAAQKEGLKRELTSGVKEAAIGEFVFGAGMNLSMTAFKYISKMTISSLATDRVSAKDRKEAITIAATQPIEVTNKALEESVNQGEITEQRANEIAEEVVSRQKALNAMPADMDLDEKNELADKVQERQKLEKEKEAANEMVKPFIELKINELDKSVAIPLPPKYIDTAGQNTSELKDGQLYITRKGDVRMWDAAQKQFLEAPRTFEVEGKKEPSEKVTEEIGEVVQPIAETTAQQVVESAVQPSVEQDRGVGAEAATPILETEQTVIDDSQKNVDVSGVATASPVSGEGKVDKALSSVEETAKALEIKNEGKADAPTKENVQERLNINNPFYKKVEDALVKLGLIEKYNPETRTGDVVGGYAQKTSDGGISAGKMLFNKDGSISYFDGDVEVSFDKNGNVISENTKEASEKNKKIEIEGKKESIANLEKTRDSENFKYKEVTETDRLGNRKKVRRLKTAQELKESTDKINSAIDKAKSELATLEGKKSEPTTVQETQAEAKSEQGLGEQEIPAKEPAPVPEITEADLPKTVVREEIDATKDEELKNQLLDEEASLRRVAEKMYQAEQAKGSKVEDIADVIEMAIADNLIRIPEEDFANYSDRNNVNEAIRKNYFTKKNQKVTPKDRLDVVAQSISDLVGFEVTEADIVDFIKKYPEGIGERGTKKQNTFFGSNNPKELARQLMHEAELAFGVELDEVGMEAFDIAVKNNREAIEELYSKPLSETEIETLSNEYDEYLNTLTDEQRKREEAKYRFDEREQVVEGTEDANLKAIKERDARQQEAERSGQKPERAKPKPKVELTPLELAKQKLQQAKEKAKAVRDSKSNLSAVSDPFGDAKKQAEADREVFDAYISLGKEYIKAGVKTVEDFAKEIGEELTDAIKKAWDNANVQYKKEVENFTTWKDYAKKQFEAEDGGLEFQEFKERFNKRFKVVADDSALVEVYSDAQSEFKNEQKKPSVTAKEIDKSIKGERKKVEVDEVAALKDQIRLEQKAAKEGAKSVTEAVKAIVGYVNDMADRGNLTRKDLAKIINLIPNAKDQKTLDATANKIFEIIDNADTDIVEVSQMKALKDQIRLEVKAAREGFKAAKAEQKDFADRIKDFLKNNKIASSLNEMQTKALVNKAASVRTEAQLDKFIEYAERVIEDAQFVVKMKEVSDLQKMANRRNHVSFNTTVKEFTSVKPEDIPDNKLGGYIDALKDLTARVPNYKKMQDMYYDIMQFKRLPNPFENLKTYKQADEALRKALSVNINTIEDFKELIKNIRAFNKKVNQLFANGDITEQDKDDLLDYLAKDMDAFEAKFGDKVDALKDNLIRDALAVQRTQEFKDAVLGLKGSSDKEVMFEFSSIKPEKLKKLPLQMLADLSDILQNVSDGFIDHQRLRDIIAESRAINNGEQLKNQIETKSPSVENVNEKVSELRTSEAAFREGDLGLGKRKAGALTKYVYNPLMTAIEKSNSETQKGVAKLQEIFKGHNKKSRFRMGIAANMLQEYMAQFDPTFEGVENIGNRDWVKETFDSGKQANFKDVNEANEVAAAWASLSGGKATKPLIGRKVATISGNAISPKDIYDSFMADDGKFLTKEERKSLAEWFKYADEVNADKQKAANEMRGLEFKPIPFYNPRIRRKGDVHVDEDVQTISVDKSNRISISSPFGKSRNTQDVGALSYDIVETAERAIAGANKDYELTKALQEVNRTLGAATNDKTKNVISVIVNDVSESLSNQFGKTIKADWIKRAQNLRSTLVQLNPLKTIKEFAATISSMPLRGGKPQGYIELLKKNGLKDILEFTGSPLAERLNVNQQFQLSEGEIKNMSPLQKMAYYLGGSPEMTMMQTVYMPIFREEFKAATGIEFDLGKFKSDEKYKSKYLDEIKDANAVATNEVQKIIGSGSRFGARREIKIPFGNNLDANTTTGQIVSFMGGYPYREQKEFWNGFKEVAEGIKGGEGIASLSSLRKPIAVTINMMVYAYMGQMVKTLASQLKGEKEKEKQEKELKEKFTEEGLTDTLIGQSVNLLAAKYGSIGSTIAKASLAIAAYNTKDKNKQNRIKEIAKENLYGFSPDIDKIMSNNKWVATQAVMKYLGELIPALGVVAETTISTKNVGVGIYEISKKVANGENVTEKEKDLWEIANVGINALHLALMKMGGGVPSYYDIKQIIEKNQKNKK